MIPFISVVIPTHNPRMDYLARVIDALREQTLSKDLWELVIVDNGSRESLEVASDQLPVVSKKPNAVDLNWHPNARVVREEKLGLTFARLRGFAEAKGELIVMVDDDNVLAPDYLATAVQITEENPALGAFGGKCLPEFEHEPPEWLKGITSGLGLRDLGEKPVVYPCEGEKVEKWDGGGQAEEHVTRRVTEFPECSPIGAGMVLRREAARAYAERLDQKTKGPKDQEPNEVNRRWPQGKQREAQPRANQVTITDRKGDSLASGGDNDICLTVIEEGWQVGYLPQLQLTHLIPARRMTLDYQQRMARDAMKSFILMLDQHGIRPWVAIPKWTVPLRVANDYLRVQPWKSPERLLRWSMHRGQYEACGQLNQS